MQISSETNYLFICFRLQQLVFPVPSIRTAQKTSTSKTEVLSISRRLLFVATLRILLFLWRAGKIVFWKKSKQAVDHGITANCAKSLQVSRLHFQFKSTWKLLWKQIPLGKAEKQDWKVMMKLKQAYRKMSDQFLFSSKVTKHLGKMGSWQRHLRNLLEKKSKSLALGRREYRGGWKMNSRGFPFVRSCLQKLKMLKISRRSVTWGEIVQLRDDRHQTVLKKYNTRLQLYRKMPLKQLSRLWGQFNQLELPMWLRSPAIRLYIWMFNCCLEEAAVQDLKQYPNVGEFFQRRLRSGVRPINSQPLTSPCDGTVLHCGLVRSNILEQVKGVTYSLEGFLGPAKQNLFTGNSEDQAFVGCGDESDVELDYSRHLLKNSVNNRLFQCIIYLAPGDYHRFHSPADWNVCARRHFPGELFSVNPSIARWLQGLFCLNERVVYSGHWSHGFMSMTPVGATNVGSITVYHDQDLLTNVERTWPRGCYYDKDFCSDGRTSGVKMKKGESFGHFSLGSTIVLLFEAPSSFRFSVKPGQKVKYGQGVGECAKRTHRRSRRIARMAKMH